MEMQNLSVFGIRDCLTEASLGWNCFGTYNIYREFYTFNDKYVRDPKSIGGGKVAALNSVFEPNQCEKTINKIKKHSKINDNEISNIGEEYLKYIKI